jgi:hypothetical protein
VAALFNWQVNENPIERRTPQVSAA